MPLIITDKRAERDRLLYNLLPGERAKIREFQNDRDPITGAELVAAAHIDHCHKTGLIRGMLNPLTNKFLIDNLDILRASIAYLENPPAPRALGEYVYGLIGKAQVKKVMLYGPKGHKEPGVRYHR
jgi:hypothetical protein